MTGKEHTIYKSYLYYTTEEEERHKEDIKSMLIEDGENEEDIAEDRLFERMLEDINMFYDDERLNLSKKVSGRILAFGTVGLWDRRPQGYKLLGHNINEILSCCECDDMRVYVDAYNVYGDFAHHDGTHHMQFREVREDRDIDVLLDKIYNGEEISRSTLNYYTKSLRKPIAEIYGW